MRRDKYLSKMRRRKGVASSVPPEMDGLDLTYAQMYFPDVYRLIPGNRIAILRNGEEAYPAMEEAIRNAQSFVSLETYIYQSDKVGWRFADALAERATAGLDVRVIYDAVGALNADPSVFQYLRDCGVQVLEYRPIMPWRKGFGVYKRDHRKMLVVDGQVGFIGGLNISSDFAPVSEGGRGWRDTLAKVEGPAVREMQKLFLVTWTRETHHPIQTNDYLPFPLTRGDSLVSVQSNREFTNRRAIRRSYLYAIRRAKAKVYVTNAYFVPDRGLLRAFSNAAKRGVDVRVIVAGKTDLMPVQLAGRASYSRLLEAGVRIYEWHDSVLHAKTAVIDEVWCAVGSYNLDHRSLFHNLEVNLNIVHPGVGQDMDRIFRDDLTRCQEIRVEEWESRPWNERAVEWFFHLFRHLM